MLTFLCIAVTIAILLYGYHIVNYAKERKIQESDVYKNAQTEWENIQNWYKSHHPKKAFPYTTLLYTGGMVATEIRIYSSEGNLRMQEQLTPSEFVLAVQKIGDHLKDYGYK